MFDLFLFADAATSRTSTLAQIKAAADSDRTIDGANRLKVPQWNKLAGAYVLGNTVGQAQLQSGRLASIAQHSIEPIDVATSPSNRPPFMDNFDAPISLDLGESLGAYAINYASELDYLAIWLQDVFSPAPTGHMRTMRATGSTTVTAAAWSNVALTLPTNIKAGTYTIVGARFHSATAILGRLRMPGYANHPGSIGMSTVAKIAPDRFRFGKAGMWGTFVHDSPPTADFYCSSADTTQVVLLDVIGPS